MNNEINYGIDNCITDLDTLIALDKRAMKDLENNTHKIEQHEVLTIIREFIRLRNDYNKEKEKNANLELCLKSEEKYSEGLNRDIKSLLNIEPNNNFISKDKIREKIKECKKAKRKYPMSAIIPAQIEILEELLEE